MAHAVGEVSGELLHFAHGVFLAMLDQHGVIFTHHLIAVLLRGLSVRAGFEVLPDLAEDPRIRTGGAADHDSVATRLADHANGIFGSENVAVTDHRNFYRG